MGIEPHVDEPLGASQIADGFTQQELLDYLIEEMISRAQEISAKRESVAIG
jgi:hypothetical protein